MELLSLEINRAENQHIYDIIKMLTDLKNNNIYIKIDSNNDDIININYGVNYLPNKKKCLEEIYTVIVNLITEYAKHLSLVYFSENYSYFDIDEVRDIERKIDEEISNDLKFSIIIRDKLKQFISLNRTINIDGFIKFRLKFIVDYSKQTVEKCIDEYLMKKEYFELINVLKYFSDYDTTENITVNIMYNNNKLQLYDENMKKINYHLSQEIAQEFENANLQYDENIMSILLAMSPKTIIFHILFDEIDIISKNTVEIIKKVFGDKIKICKGCKYCEFKKNK